MLERRHVKHTVRFRAQLIIAARPGPGTPKVTLPIIGPGLGRGAVCRPNKNNNKMPSRASPSPSIGNRAGLFVHPRPLLCNMRAYPILGSRARRGHRHWEGIIVRLLSAPRDDPHGVGRLPSVLAASCSAVESSPMSEAVGDG